MQDKLRQEWSDLAAAHTDPLKTAGFFPHISREQIPEVIDE